MTTFKVNGTTEIKCIYKKTRNGFCHKAAVYVNGDLIGTYRESYLNRTWERYEFQTVLRTALEKSKVVSKDQIEPLLDAWGKDPELNGMGALKSLGMIMKLGSILSENNQSAANDWKLRMLKAGIPEGSLSMPDDWDTLSEDEKQRRLDGIANILIGKKVN